MLRRKTRRDRMSRRGSTSRRNCGAADTTRFPSKGVAARVVRGYFAYHAVPTNFPC